MKVYRRDERTDVGYKAMNPKYYKNDAYALAHKMSFLCFSLFWPKKVYFMAKIDSLFSLLC
jgi:hypothetical protein